VRYRKKKKEEEVPKIEKYLKMFYISDTDEKEMEIPCVDYERARANDDSFIHSLLFLVWGSMCQYIGARRF